MSSDTSLRSRRPSGTSPSTIRWASPSTIAVLPTPGSPIRTGLFFVRRLSTWITRRISSSRPITGSSLPVAAASVRSRPKRSSAWNLSSGFWSVTLWLPRTSASALSSCSREAPDVRSASPALPGCAAIASSRCSVETYSSLSSRISVSAVRRIWTSSAEPPAGSAPPCPLSFGSASSARPSSWRIDAGSTPSLRSTGTTTPPSCSSSTASRCSGVVWGLRRSSASRCAAWSASCVLIVSRSGCMGFSCLRPGFRAKSKSL